MDCPCKDCLMLGRCKAIYLEDLIGFLTNLGKSCSLLNKYLVIHHSSTRIQFDIDNLVETGNILGFDLEKRGHTIYLTRKNK